MKIHENNARKMRILLDAGEELVLKWNAKDNPYDGVHMNATIEGKSVGCCRGCGYDMRGTCFAEFLNNAFGEELKALDEKKEYYGLRQYGGKVNGGCGLNCMFDVFEGLGYEAEWISNTGNGKYILRKKGA